MARLKTKFRELLRRRGYELGKVTKPAPLHQLVHALRPVAIDTDLVRVGSAGDGGYLVPDDLEGIYACFSPGVSTSADFEDDLATRAGIRSFLADYSVDAPPMLNDAFDFEKKFLGLGNDDVFMRLESWMNRKLGPHDGDCILQMDIEGAEWEVLIDTPASVLRRFRIIVIEWHDLQLILQAQPFRFCNAVFRKLLEDFAVVHLHPNNCCPVFSARGVDVPSVMEMTLLRRDRVRPAVDRMTFPHPLDATNVPSLPDIRLPHAWWPE